MKSDWLTPRIAFALAAAVCALLLGYGYFLQYVQGLNPCPLCLVQRTFYYGVLAVSLVAALHGPGPLGTSLYGVGALLFALGGVATAGRQVWLQHLPKDKVPQCGPDLYFMLDNLGFSATLQKLLHGTGECAEVDWTFLGFSIAEWSLAWFVALALYAAWMIFFGARSVRSNTRLTVGRI
jgi:disulfide bond formation protein DsbB